MQFEEIGNKDGFYIHAMFPGNLIASANTDVATLHCTTKPFEVISVSVTYSTKDNNGATVNLYKDLAGQAIGGGELFCPYFDLTTTTGEKQIWTKTRDDFDQTMSSRGGKMYQFKEGDRLNFFSANTPINLRNLNITIYCKPLGKGDYR